MKRNEPVSHIMTKSLLTVTLANKPSDVRKLFEKHQIHHLPVVSGEELLGLISVFDLMKVTFGAPGEQDPRALDAMLDHSYTLESFMSRGVVTMQAGDTVRRAAELLSEGRYHAVPVLEDKKLVGIVTSTDLIKYLLDQM